MIIIDRSNNELPLGLELTDAVSPSAGVPVTNVSESGQAAGKLRTGDLINSVDHMNVVGWTAVETLRLIKESDDLVEITIDRPPSMNNRVVTLDRTLGRLGIKLGNSATQRDGVPILGVDSGGQADGKIYVGDQIIAVNNQSSVGLTMTEAARLIAQSDVVELTIR